MEGASYVAEKKKAGGSKDFLSTIKLFERTAWNAWPNRHYFGMVTVEQTEGGWVTPGGRFLDVDALQRHITDIIFGLQSYGAWDAALIEYRVRAHPFFTRLYDRGLPDLRVITHQGRLVQAMLRMPTSASSRPAMRRSSPMRRASGSPSWEVSKTVSSSRRPV